MQVHFQQFASAFVVEWVQLGITWFSMMYFLRLDFDNSTKYPEKLEIEVNSIRHSNCHTKFMLYFIINDQGLHCWNILAINKVDLLV